MNPPGFVRRAWIPRKMASRSAGEQSMRWPIFIHGRQVTIEAYKHHRYGRLIGELADLDLCLTMVASGMPQPTLCKGVGAWMDLLAEAEQGVRAHRAGVWADARPEPLWEFRR